MARRVEWSHEASAERRAILHYWKTRNQNNQYARKLNQEFKEALKLICRYPYLGRPVAKTPARALVVVDYLIVYYVLPNEIWIISLWDTRQDPEKLSL